MHYTEVIIKLGLEGENDFRRYTRKNIRKWKRKLNSFRKQDDGEPLYTFVAAMQRSVAELYRQQRRDMAALGNNTQHMTWKQFNSQYTISLYYRDISSSCTGTSGSANNNLKDHDNERVTIATDNDFERALYEHARQEIDSIKIWGRVVSLNQCHTAATTQQQQLASPPSPRVSAWSRGPPPSNFGLSSSSRPLTTDANSSHDFTPPPPPTAVVLREAMIDMLSVILTINNVDQIIASLTSEQIQTTLHISTLLKASVTASPTTTTAATNTAVTAIDNTTTTTTEATIPISTTRTATTTIRSANNNNNRITSTTTTNSTATTAAAAAGRVVPEEPPIGIATPVIVHENNTDAVVVASDHHHRTEVVDRIPSLLSENTEPHKVVNNNDDTSFETAMKEIGRSLEATVLALATNDSLHDNETPTATAATTQDCHRDNNSLNDDSAASASSSTSHDSVGIINDAMETTTTVAPSPILSNDDNKSNIPAVATVMPLSTTMATTPQEEDPQQQHHRWRKELDQLHQLGFWNDTLCIEALEDAARVAVVQQHTDNNNNVESHDRLMQHAVERLLNGLFGN